MRLRVNPGKCTGCRSCMLICSFMHADECNYHDSRVKIVSEETRGKHTPVICRFCEEPACVSACPTGALSRNEANGVILVASDLCNGCEACVGACPFEAMFFNPKTGRPFTCDLCQGDPECVKVCQLPEALVYA